jgi:hypothetical protein
VVVGSVMLGALSSRYWKHRAILFPWHVGEGERAASGMTDAWILLIWLIATLAPLTLTALNLSGWSTMGFHPAELGVRSAAFFALFCDLLFSTWFILRSGGWTDSPFTSIMVAVPTFAILLGESFAKIAIYIIYVIVFSAICFYLNASLGFGGTHHQKDRRLLNLANWLLSSIMFALTAWIGLFGAR